MIFLYALIQLVSQYIQYALNQQIQLLARMESQNLNNYEIIRLQPSSIIMRNIYTRKMYKYTEDPLLITNKDQYPKLKNISNPLKFNYGHLFEIGLVDLETQLLSINRSNNTYEKQKNNNRYNNSVDEWDLGEQVTKKQENERQQLMRNTLSPILSALQQLHQNNVIHGCISAKSIFSDEFGSINMYYPGLQNWARQYYFTKQDHIADISKQLNPQYKTQKYDKNINRNDDYRALGILALKIMGINTNFDIKHVKQILDQLLLDSTICQNTYIILRILLKQESKFYQYLTELLENPQHYRQQRYKSFRQIFKKTNKPKNIHKIKTQNNNQSILNKRYYAHQQFTPPLIKHTNQLSPKKMLQITKKLMKIEDCQNKKASLKGKDEEYLILNKKKKTHNDNALKKMSNGKTTAQQCNSNVNCMVLRGQNYCSPKANNKTCVNIYNQSPSQRKAKQIKQKQDLYKLGTLIRQRMRTISKKKLNN